MQYVHEHIACKVKPGKGTDEKGILKENKGRQTLITGYREREPNSFLNTSPSPGF